MLETGARFQGAVEQISAEDIDDSADHNDSKEVLRAKIADKIETSKGVDITPELHRATIAKAKTNNTLKKEIKAVTAKPLL